ncbi:MAG TPA: hypothetical protein VMW38_28585, partial [Terriglobia bacterium]|nr:hypothetical protein [Terriglobia bacterium]
VGIEILIGRKELEAADAMALYVRHHYLGDIGIVRIDGTEGNQLRMTFTKVEDEIVRYTSGDGGVVGNADSVVDALAFEELDELLGSHQRIH